MAAEFLKNSGQNSSHKKSWRRMMIINHNVKKKTEPENLSEMQINSKEEFQEIYSP